VTDAVEIVALFRQTVELLSEIDSPAATAAGAVIKLWLAGMEFEDAAGLASGWRRIVKEHSRDVALKELLKLHTDMSASHLGARIIAGIALAARTRGGRPDGERGLFWDLLKADATLGLRQWIRLIEENR
jgi:hypothetical protein